jgi:hypothetical protein
MIVLVKTSTLPTHKIKHSKQFNVYTQGPTITHFKHMYLIPYTHRSYVQNHFEIQKHPILIIGNDFTYNFNKCKHLGSHMHFKHFQSNGSVFYRRAWQWLMKVETCCPQVYITIINSCSVWRYLISSYVVTVLAKLNKLSILWTGRPGHETYMKFTWYVWFWVVLRASVGHCNCCRSEADSAQLLCSISPHFLTLPVIRQMASPPHAPLPPN